MANRTSGEPTKPLFWAQSLDNSSSDHIKIREEIVNPGEHVRRQEVVSDIYAVFKHGKIMKEKEGVRLTAAGRRFVIEVPSVESDQRGRNAPIIYYNIYGKNLGQNPGANFVQDIETFAEQIGRTIQYEALEVARRSLNELEITPSTHKMLKLVSIIAAGLILAFFLYWIFTII